MQKVMGQAGTWDPLRECLHLDKCLLSNKIEKKKTNKKKTKGTKHTCTHAKAVMNNKIQKHYKPTGISELLGAKQGTVHDLGTWHLQDGEQTT